MSLPSPMLGFKKSSSTPSSMFPAASIRNPVALCFWSKPSTRSSGTSPKKSYEPLSHPSNSRERRRRSTASALATALYVFPDDERPSIIFNFVNMKLTNISRSFSLQTAQPFNQCSRSSHCTPTSSPSGPHSPTACTNTPSGQPLRPKAWAPTSSITTR